MKTTKKNGSLLHQMLATLAISQLESLRMGEAQLRARCKGENIKGQTKKWNDQATKT
jgi:hypothetical protein